MHEPKTRDKEWRELSLHKKQEANQFCALCQYQYPLNYLVLHHLNPEDDTHVVILCQDCHNKVHNRKSKPPSSLCTPCRHYYSLNQSYCLKSRGKHPCRYFEPMIKRVDWKLELERTPGGAAVSGHTGEDPGGG